MSNDPRPRRKCATCGVRTRARSGYCRLHRTQPDTAATVVVDVVDKELLRARVNAEASAARSELKRLATIENHKRDVIATVERMAPVLVAPRLEITPTRGHKPVHTWAPVLSDWQLGQRDTLQSTGGMFEQSTEIVKGQVRNFWTVIERLHDIYRPAVNVEELVIFSLGDLLENDQMRASQAGHIDSLVTQQAVDVTDLMSWTITQALARFPKVRVLHVGGNHDRTSSKPGNAGLGELGFTDTYSWLIGEFLKRLHARSIDTGRLVFNNHTSFFGAAKVAGLRMVYEHGASFKSSVGSYGGVSYYSIAKAAGGYQTMLDGADVVLMGHHHTGMVLPLGGWGWQVMNGALTPSSSYGQPNFKSVRRPLQILLDLNEKHGLVGWKPIYLETESLVRPGQFWESAAMEAAS